MLDFITAIIYGILQGVTEWLPISSTGHMLLLDDYLPLPFSSAFREFFLVAVQLGSLAAVPVLFRDRFDLRRADNRRLWRRVLPAVIPAGLAGLCFDDIIDRYLYRPAVIAAALIVYGIFFVFLRPSSSISRTAHISADSISYPRALGIGLFQMLALIPGTSRSGATMLGGALLGLSQSVSAEFSFFLALPTMLAAAGYKGLKFVRALAGGEVSASPREWVMLALAAALAYAVSRVAIRFLLDAVRRHGFMPFGIYRILLGAAVLLFGR